MNLPTIVAAGHFSSGNKFPGIKKTPPRKVHCFELEIFSGNTGTSFVNGEEFPIEKGNVLFAKPGDIRYSLLPFECDYLHFDNVPEEILACFDNLPSVFKLADPDATMEILTRIIKDYCSEYAFDNISASANLILLLREISSRRGQEASLAQKALNVIKQSYTEELTAEEIARRCFISVSYLHKVYSKAFGIGPAEALLNHRLYKAKEMILNTNLSLGEIAQSCGFGSQSYFSDCFKHKNGISPKEFKKINSINLK